MTQFNERVTIYQYMDASLNNQMKAGIECESQVFLFNIGISTYFLSNWFSLKKNLEKEDI